MLYNMLYILKYRMFVLMFIINKLTNISGRVVGLSVRHRLFAQRNANPLQNGVLSGSRFNETTRAFGGHHYLAASAQVFCAAKRHIRPISGLDVWRLKSHGPS